MKGQREEDAVFGVYRIQGKVLAAQGVPVELEAHIESVGRRCSERAMESEPDFLLVYEMHAAFEPMSGICAAGLLDENAISWTLIRAQHNRCIWRLTDEDAWSFLSEPRDIETKRRLVAVFDGFREELTDGSNCGQ
jgi:hypothetical protein